MVQSGNFLVMQSGGPTPVINRSLYGVFDEASKKRGVKVLGAINGIEGLKKLMLMEWIRQLT